MAYRFVHDPAPPTVHPTLLTALQGFNHQLFISDAGIFNIFELHKMCIYPGEYYLRTLLNLFHHSLYFAEYQ